MHIHKKRIILFISDNSEIVSEPKVNLVDIFSQNIF